MPFMDWVHGTLDVAGMVPVIGEVADGVNAGLYAVQGDLVNAGISLAGMIPVGGQAITGTRVAVKVGGEVLQQAEKQVLKEGGQEIAQQGGKQLEKEVADASGSAAKNVGVKVSKKPSLREKYMGKTPGKYSKTGKEVQEKMRKEGTLRDNAITGEPEFQASNGNWYPLSEADMSHKTDAVKWWNDTGRSFGAKSPEVRTWMKDPNNYRLDHYSINRASGAKLPDRYMPPAVP